MCILRGFGRVAEAGHENRDKRDEPCIHPDAPRRAGAYLILLEALASRSGGVVEWLCSDVYVAYVHSFLDW